METKLALCTAQENKLAAQNTITLGHAVFRKYLLITSYILCAMPAAVEVEGKTQRNISYILRSL